jgi:diguanylate cyclase (GGDEF)-like protein/PAS domain S-box-containing protein
MARLGLNNKGQRGVAAELSLRSAFDYAPIGMAVLTPDGVVITCNAALGELLGRVPESLAGTTLFQVTHADDRPQAQQNCALIRSGTQRILRHECRLVRGDTTPVWVLVSTAAVPEAPGRPAHLIMHIEDIDERKALEAELVYRAQHDPLTGLANRHLLKQRLDDALCEDSRRSCLLFVDLDGFKAVNDRHGHIAGDLVLQQLAQRLTALLRPQDVCARLGGDEFVVLCVDTEPHQADAIADRLRAAVAEPFTVDGRTIEITAAVGVGATGVARSTPVDANGLIRQADERMYEAKRRRP